MQWRAGAGVAGHTRETVCVGTETEPGSDSGCSSLRQSRCSSVTTESEETDQTLRPDFGVGNKLYLCPSCFGRRSTIAILPD